MKIETEQNLDSGGVSSERGFPSVPCACAWSLTTVSETCSERLMEHNTSANTEENEAMKEITIKSNYRLETRPGDE